LDRKKAIRDTAYIALTAAIITVCSWITIPMAVPFTLQTFAVFCAVLLLGGRNGSIAVALYILLGAVGVPVFSGFKGGIGHILGPTGGYIVGFVFITICYLIFEPLFKKSKWLKIPVLILGLLICYLFGTLWFSTVMTTRGNEYGIMKVLSLCVFPFVLPDTVKLILAFFICDRVKRAVPGLRENA